MISNEQLAKELTTRLFESGADDHPCTRIQFIGGDWPNHEYRMGGMNEPALTSWLKSQLDQIRPEDVTNSPLAQAVLERVAGVNLGIFLTSAIDHIEKGGNSTSGEVELTSGVKVELIITRIKSNVSSHPNLTEDERKALSEMLKYAAKQDGITQHGVFSPGGWVGFTLKNLLKRTEMPTVAMNEIPIAWVSPIDWNPRQSEIVRKLTRGCQPEHGFTVPLYVGPPKTSPGNAAPDLLAAEKHIVEILRHPSKSVSVLDCEKLEAAIENAEGHTNG